MNNKESKFPKKITVDKEIVRILSGSTYESFPKTLKELITNSYDADASRVDVNINLKKQEITIEDNGVGMDVGDFDFYLRIAGKKRKRESETSSGRKRIGKFGVGFLSVFPFVNNYYIESTKKGISNVFFAEIECGRYFADSPKSINVDQIPIQGGVVSKPKLKNKSFTKITLSGFSQFGKAFFEEKYKIDSRRNTIKKYDSLKRLKWELCEDLPIEYPDGSELKELFPINVNDPFEVFFNDKKNRLAKKVHINRILDYSNNDSFYIGKVKFKYFIGVEYKAIKPVEARFLKLRNLEAGVGARTTFDIGLDGRTYAYLSHLSGEIFVEEGLNELITVSRDKFNFNTDFDSFISFFRKKLRKLATFLDEEAKIKKLEKQRTDTTKISDIQNLDTENIKKTKERFEKKKKTFKIKDIEDLTKKKKVEKTEIKNENDELIYSNISSNNNIKHPKVNPNEKLYSFRNITYKVTLDRWEINNESEFQIGQIKGKKLILNKEHPLLQNKRYSDLFIKFYLICYFNYKESQLNKRTFIKIQTELSQTFKDYK